jgi:hypothetical protein
MTAHGLQRVLKNPYNGFIPAKAPSVENDDHVNRRGSSPSPCEWTQRVRVCGNCRQSSLPKILTQDQSFSPHLGAGSSFRVTFHRFDEGVHDSGCQVSPGLPGFAFAHGSSFAGFGLADARLGVGVEEAD